MNYLHICYLNAHNTIYEVYILPLYIYIVKSQIILGIAKS